MRSRSETAAVVLSAAALVVFAVRAVLDWLYVFPELAPGASSLVGAIAYLVLLGGWFWALRAARAGRHRGLAAALAFAIVLPIGLGIATLAAFCPSPCGTAWPLMELANWAGLLAGLGAVVAAVVVAQRDGLSSARG